MTAVGDTNQLITIPGGVHGSFNPEQATEEFEAPWKFLDAQHLTGDPQNAPSEQPK